MKSIIRSFRFGLIFVVPVGLIFASNLASALSESQLDMFSQNDIMFYDPAEVERGNCGSSTICGSTAKEKYWSILVQTFDDIHAAAIMGSLVNEGNFGPTRWEVGSSRAVEKDGGKFVRDWDDLYNCTRGNCPVGVGTFGITWTLGPYLHYINDADSKLLEYFKDPENYSWPGDEALKRIGAADFDRIVELEVGYVLKEANVEAFKTATTLQEATDWWTKNYENCKNCCGNADDDKSCEEIEKRRTSANKVYEELKDYTCSGSSNAAATSTTATTCGFVWYGQCDPTWANEVYGNRGSICQSGCGPSSFAMLATMLLGKSITPHETNDIAGGNNKTGTDYHGANGSDWGVTKALVEELADRYNEPGFKYETVSIPSKEKAKEIINEYLKNGWMIHASGRSNISSSPFTSGGHYIGIRGITSDGKWLIADSNNWSSLRGPGEENSKKEWDPDEILEGIRIDNTHAISKEGVNCSGANSMSPCSNFDTDGLTIEQAKQFVMNYGENKNNSSKDAVGEGMWNIDGCEGGNGSNCVTFSAFFMRKFANIPTPPSSKWGDGGDVVSNLKSRSDISITSGTEPKVFSVFSSPGHTAVVLGHHDGKWIVGHAGCSYEGTGKGNGGDGTWSNRGGGSAFIIIETDDDPSKWSFDTSGIEFAYLNVDVSAIERYLTNGE